MKARWFYIGIILDRNSLHRDNDCRYKRFSKRVIDLEGGSCGRFSSEINSLSVPSHFRRTAKGFMHRAILLHKKMRGSLASTHFKTPHYLENCRTYYTHRLASIVMNIARDKQVSSRDCMIIVIKAVAEFNKYIPTICINSWLLADQFPCSHDWRCNLFF